MMSQIHGLVIRSEYSDKAEEMATDAIHSVKDKVNDLAGNEKPADENAD